MRYGTRSLTAGVALAVGILMTATTDAMLSRTGDATVVAHATATGGLSINATSTDVRISQPGTVEVVVPLSTLTTGIKLRDKHMRERYLEADKYPNAVLRVERSLLKFPDDGGEVAADAPASLTLHGQTKPVSIHYSARRGGVTFAVEGRTRINILDFGITQPRYLTVTVKPEVDIDIRFQVRDI